MTSLEEPANTPDHTGSVTRPSGTQVSLSFEEQTATVVEVGGGLRTYQVASCDVLDGYGETEPCPASRGQHLIPWPNRLRDGSYKFADREHQLALNEPANNNAIHGLVRWANWQSSQQRADRVTMFHTLHPQPGWPFSLELQIEYSLDAHGLSVRTTATNSGGEPCPYGAGSHPYLTLGTRAIDDLSLCAPGATWLRNDTQAIPIAAERVEGTEFDFLSARTIGSSVLDTGYTDLLRDSEGRARVELTDQATGNAVTLWMDESYQYLMLFTGDTLAEIDRRRTGLAVEPMTCAPNAFQTGAGLQRLEPGQSFTSSWGITPSITCPIPT